MAHSCIELNNYNTTLEILAGLNHGAVQRLKGIWDVRNSYLIVFFFLYVNSICPDLLF